MTTSNTPGTILIMGAGYLGRPLSFKLQKNGHTVVAVNRTEPTRPITLGVLFRNCEVTPEAYRALLAEVQPKQVVICWAPGPNDTGDYEKAYMESMSAFCKALESHPPEHVVYTSSTSLYETDRGDIVSEVDLGQPHKRNALILHQAEQQLLIYSKKTGFKTTILRLAGLYGPDRIPGLRLLRRGQPISGHGNSWTNLIHRDDAINAIELCLQGGREGIYNISDDSHHTRQELYERVAGITGLPLCGWTDPDPGRTTGKRVSSAKARRDLGWTPTHPDHQEWIEQYLQSHPH